MIIFANHNLTQYIINHSKSVIMNLFSKLIVGETVFGITPPHDIFVLLTQSLDDAPFNDEYKVQLREEFRSRYLAYLCEYEPFMGIMDIIIADYHTDDNVIILTDLDNEIVSNIIECIAQFIYDRWHYSTATVNDIEDLNNITVSEVEPEFLGVYHADIDFYMKNRKDESNDQ